jgi:hypothetical protein
MQEGKISHMSLPKENQLACKILLEWEMVMKTVLLSCVGLTWNDSYPLFLIKSALALHGFGIYNIIKKPNPSVKHGVTVLIFMMDKVFWNRVQNFISKNLEYVQCRWGQMFLMDKQLIVSEWDWYSETLSVQRPGDRKYKIWIKQIHHT